MENTNILECVSIFIIAKLTNNQTDKQTNKLTILKCGNNMEQAGIELGLNQAELTN